MASGNSVIVPNHMLGGDLFKGGGEAEQRERASSVVAG